MNLIRSIVTVLSCSAIIFAAGSNGGSNGTDSGSNGSSGDMTEITGTVEQVSPEDSMLVVKSDIKTDTVYIMQETQMTTSLDQLKQGDQVMVKYQMMDNRKVATSVESHSGNGGGSNGEKDTMPQDTGM